MEHTKGIWRTGEHDIRNSAITIWSDNNNVVLPRTIIGYVSTQDTQTDEEAEANAEYICAAVNAHASLTEQVRELKGELKTMIDFAETFIPYDILRNEKKISERIDEAKQFLNSTK